MIEKMAQARSYNLQTLEELTLTRAGTARGMAIAWTLLVVSSERQSDTLQYQRAWADGICSDKAWELTRCVEGVASGKDGPRRLSRDLVLQVRAAPSRRGPSMFS